MCQVVRLQAVGRRRSLRSTRCGTMRRAWCGYAVRSYVAMTGNTFANTLFMRERCPIAAPGAGVSLNPRGFEPAPALCAEPNQCAEHDGRRTRAAC